MSIKIFTENKALTSFIIVGWMAGAIALLVMSKTQNEHGKQTVDCDGGYSAFIPDHSCDAVQFLRPFRFSVSFDDYKNCGAFICGWSKSASDFHIVNASFTLIGGILMMVQMWSVEDKTLQLVCIILALALAACYFSSFSIDADNVRTGNNFCKDNWKMGSGDNTWNWISWGDNNSFDCKPTPFVFTLLAEIGLSMLSFLLFIIFFYAKWSKDKYIVNSTNADSRPLSPSMIQVGGGITDPSPSIQAAQQRTSMMTMTNMTTADSGASERNPFDTE